MVSKLILLVSLKLKCKLREKKEDTRIKEKWQNMKIQILRDLKEINIKTQMNKKRKEKQRSKLEDFKVWRTGEEGSEENKHNQTTICGSMVMRP